MSFKAQKYDYFFIYRQTAFIFMTESRELRTGAEGVAEGVGFGCNMNVTQS